MQATGQWSSSKVVASATWPGVELVLARMSFGRRLELMKRVRDLAGKAEFFEAGTGEKSRIEAGVLSAEIDRLYVAWGVAEVRGLELDGQPATVAMLIDSGPEELFREALGAVKAECGLGEQERKN